MENNKEFGKIRSIIFPIYREELRKFIPLSLTFFFISFNYAALRNLKDMFLIESAGSEAIYYLKVAGVLPTVILFTIIYSKITSFLGRDGRFNVVIIYFLSFFAIFLFFLLPSLEALKLNAVADYLNTRFSDFKGLWEAIRIWPLSLFYINAEAWGTFALSVLFWTFANDIISVGESKRFYSFLAIGANVGLIVAGFLLKMVGKHFNLMLGMVLVLGVILLIVYNLFSRDIRKHPELYQVVQKPKKKKVKLSFKESFKFLMKSEYLGLVAILVISYGMVTSLFESVWKSQIEKLFIERGGDRGILGEIYANQSIFIGITTTLLVLFLSAPIMRKGWRFAALITPIVASIGGVLFFGFMIFGEYFKGISAFFGVTPLFIIVIFGLINVTFIKSAKYTLFDPTKEATYIPLDEESKIRGKAAVDGVGSRLGKSLGSFLLTTWVVPFLGGGKIDNVKQYILVLIALVLIGWIIAVKKLNVKFQALTKKVENENETPTNAVKQAEHV
ncbi:MAG: NTP/NDP exchange transporter [Cytophagales bacterium]|nr:NTP/NDP exchange transporter [Cytophagales bacterium]